MKLEKPYSIYKTGDYYLIIANNYQRLEEYSTLLNGELSKKELKGEIVFDLLLSNGDNSQRFFKAIFDGYKILMTSYTSLSPDQKILKKTAQYFRKNKSLFDNSVLSSREIKRILTT